MDDRPKKLYEGSSKAVQPPNAEPALKYAILDAYNKGMDDKRGQGLIDNRPDEECTPENPRRTFQYRVEAIFVEGSNPPTDYKVYLTDT